MTASFHFGLSSGECQRVEDGAHQSMGKVPGWPAAHSTRMALAATWLCYSSEMRGGDLNLQLLFQLCAGFVVAKSLLVRLL
ncbi:MAG: hypothetical protein P1U86_05020 [Verrucomicrobiales bacterium]|nr:hypothetical protein [Verrucomicrobiales bacterium]